MRNKTALGMLTMILLVGSAQLVLADAAPPQQAPGSTIESGGFETNVQMVSEEVLMVIGDAEEPVTDWDIISNYFQGHVEATFWMQNQGKETESFDVWFPLGAEDGWLDVSVVENFAAWVDGVPAEIGQEELPGEWDDPVPWATWPVTFPPGETVVLTVSYDIRPTGFIPYGELIYILETGAGWWGVIGEGTVTVRLPYDVNEKNVPWYSGAPNTDRFAIDDFEIVGTDLIWRFTDLEPTRKDNIRVEVLAPSQWEAVLAAEEAVADNPDSAEAYLQLAQAQANGLQFKYGLICCDSLADLAVENFQQALALAPDDIDVQVAYLDLLLSLWFPYAMDTYSEDIPTLIQTLLISAPEDEHFLELLPQAMGSFRWSSEINDEDSEDRRLLYGEIMAALAEATEANPDNTGLFEIYDEFTPKG